MRVAFLPLLVSAACLDPVVYRLGEDTSDTGSSTQPTTTPVCAFPDHVSLTRSVGLTGLTHAYVPGGAETVLALAHAEAALATAGPAGAGWRSTDLFALALEATAMGCDEWAPDDLHGVSYASDPLTVADGCFGVVETTAWTDFCRLWPAACGDHAALISADQPGHFERGVHVAAHSAVFLTALLADHGADDPEAWLAAASDPAVRPKLLAIAWFDSPFSDQLDAAVAGCADRPVESCLTEGWLADRVERVGAHATDLRAARDAGSCATGTVSEAALDRYLEHFAALFADEDALALGAVARGSLGGGSYADLPAVARAIEDARLTPLTCPTDLLQTWYGVDCP